MAGVQQRCLKLFCRYDFFARQEANVGQHMAGVRCLDWLPERGLLATAPGTHTQLLGSAHPAGIHLACKHVGQATMHA